MAFTDNSDVQREYVQKVESMTPDERTFEVERVQTQCKNLERAVFHPKKDVPQQVVKQQRTTLRGYQQKLQFLNELRKEFGETELVIKKENVHVYASGIGPKGRTATDLDAMQERMSQQLLDSSKESASYLLGSELKSKSS